jgi:TonB family protein
MRSYLFLFFLLGSYYGIAQQTAYQPFEVDSVAEPRGGLVYLNTFIQANLVKPIEAEAKGIGGRVTLTGVVEPDGHLADIKVIQSLRPDCDREATRVLKLFKAWKPARKAGQTVRQLVTVLVPFKANEPFIYKDGARVSYFDKKDGFIVDSSVAARKQITPLDTNGLPAGDVVLYGLEGKRWRESHRLKFVHKQHSKGQTLGYQNFNKLWQGVCYALDSNGQLVDKTFYNDGRTEGPFITFYPNGVVAQKTDEVDSKKITTSWYVNGQIKQIEIAEKTKLLSPGVPDQVTAFWDSTGQQLVKDGAGRATYTSVVTSDADTTKQTILTEQGLYENRLKQGVWTGKYADGSYFYEEVFDKGICKGGKAKTPGSDTIRYTERFRQPEFQGGLNGLGQFLSSNLQYPTSAQRDGVQGKVFISFVVCTDGTLCDYEVLSSVHPDLDQEALRVVKKMSGKWKPGVQRGQNVRVKYNLPINFAFN